MPKTWSSAVLIALVALVALAPSLARADAIEGPPACPPGARGRSSHSGQWCDPWPCTSDSECEGGTCRRWRVCTRVADVPFGGHRMYRPGEPTSYEAPLVVGTCDPARACNGTEEPPPPIAGTLREGAPNCTEATFCVPAALPDLPPRRASAPVRASETAAPPRHVAPPASSSGCAVVSGASPATAMGIAVMLALALLCRRRS